MCVCVCVHVRVFRRGDQRDQVVEIEEGQHGVDSLGVGFAHVAVGPVRGVWASAAMVLRFGWGRIRAWRRRKWVGASIGSWCCRARSGENVDGIRSTASFLTNAHMKVLSVNHLNLTGWLQITLLFDWLEPIKYQNH